MITENLSTLKIHKLTQAQYGRELAAGNIDPSALYLTPDEGTVDLSGYATTEYVDNAIPSKTSDLTNDSSFATEDYVKNKIAEAELSSGDVDLTGYATKEELPTKVSQLENDSGYLTSYTETDPTVPAWAKASKKPSYTADEVGALPSTTVIPTVPTKVSAFTNDAGYLTQHQDISGKLDASELQTAINTALSKTMMKSDVSIKKAKLTLADGSTVLIDVVVASEGTSIQQYTNQVPLSTDTDGSIFNGNGYQIGYRLSSSGATKEEAYSVVTGYIPAKAGDVIRIAGCGWHHALATNYLCAYKADYSFIGAVTSNLGKYGTQIHTDVALEPPLATVTLADVADVAYIRVSAANDGNCEYCSAYTLGTDMIVTINEEIT